MTETHSRKREEVPAPVVTLAQKRALRGAVVGQFVEWYDFLIYASSAPVLAAHFFTDSSPEAALLGTFAIYGVGFVMRPVGGLFFGRYGDRLGRRNVLAATILIMGGATLVSGLLPTYASIGLVAPALLLVCRLVQGFAAGGEASGMGPLVIETAPADRRGRWIGAAFSASYLPSAVAGFLILGLSSWFGAAGYHDWAWRIPFVMGGVLAVVGLLIRLRVEESAEFTEIAKEGEISSAPIKQTTTTHARGIVLVCLVISVLAIGGYTVHSYMYSYLTGTVGLGTVPALLSTTMSVLLIVGMLPVCGHLADQVGRRPMMYAGAASLAVVALPAYLLCGTASFAGALVAQLLIGAGLSIFGGGGYVVLYELFPTHVRATGIGLSYNLGYAIFGGTMPFISQLLVDTTGVAIAPAFYMILICLAALWFVRFIPETVGRDLSTSALEDTK